MYRYSRIQYQSICVWFPLQGSKTQYYIQHKSIYCLETQCVSFLMIRFIYTPDPYIIQLLLTGCAGHRTLELQNVYRTLNHQAEIRSWGLCFCPTFKPLENGLKCGGKKGEIQAMPMRFIPLGINYPCFRNLLPCSLCLENQKKATGKIVSDCMFVTVY